MTRVEVFSDAVLAIAITLLVLELPFDKVGHGELAEALGHQWPSFGAYALSFFGIGILWLHHHALFAAIAEIDRPLLLLNLVLLLAAAFLPFPTALVGDYLREGGADARIAVVIYSGTWVAVSLTAMIMCRRAIRTPGMLSADVPVEGARRLLRNFQIATVAYVLFALVAIVSPIGTMACYGAAALYFLWRSDYRALGKRTVETSEP